MEHLLNPVTYVNRHLEPSYESGKDMHQTPRQTPSKVELPLDAVRYQDAGKVELRTDNVVVYYEYHPATNVPSKKDSDELLGSSDDWRNLSQLVLLNEENGVTVELQDLYPVQYDTSFRVNNEAWHDSYHDFSTRKVVVGSSLVSTAQLAILLHEVGHAVDKVRNPYLYSGLAHIMWKSDRGDPAAQSMLLMKERNAWAFALNTLRPFMSNDPTSAFHSPSIQNFIHKSCLQTYSDEFRRASEGRKRYLGSLGISSAN